MPPSLTGTGPMEETHLPEEKKDVTSYTTDTDFMREQIKQRPVNRRRLFRRTMLTVLLAVVFGVVACATFLLLEPVFNRVLNPETEPVPNPVVFPEEVVADELQPEDLYADETEMQQAIGQEEGETPAGEPDLLLFYQTRRNIALEGARSIVTITIHQSGTGLAGDPFETSGTVFGLAVADNGYQRLIVTDYGRVRDAEALDVTFYNGARAEAQLLCADTVTGLCILAVSHDAFTAEVLDALPLPVLGSSAAYTVVGSPVIAIGEPTGMPASIAYGSVTGNARSVLLPDAAYSLLTTDLYGYPRSGGVLLDMRGEVVGIFMPTLTSHLSDDAEPPLITAYGISGIRRLIEKLSNNSPRALLGVIGTDVPADIREREDIPPGAYVQRVEMNTPAMASAIQAGDVIVAVGDTEIASFSALTAALLDMTPQQTVPVTLMRTGPDGYTTIELEITLSTTSE